MFLFYFFQIRWGIIIREQDLYFLEEPSMFAAVSSGGLFFPVIPDMVKKSNDGKPCT
jgi:hypothetical protein